MCTVVYKILEYSDYSANCINPLELPIIAHIERTWSANVAFQVPFRYGELSLLS
jgi:hypothetical protein